MKAWSGHLLRNEDQAHVQAEGWQAKMGWGYELLGLEAHELIWEHSLDTKALLGWGAGGITIAFRGTASLRNALSDLQVRPHAAALSTLQTTNLAGNSNH